MEEPLDAYYFIFFMIYIIFHQVLHILIVLICKIFQNKSL